MSAAQNNWVPRRKEDGPKTIKQIQQEVKQVGEREQLQLKKGHDRVQGGSAEREVTHGRLDQSSSCGCDGSRKQACHCEGSSSVSSEENRCWRTQNARDTKQEDPVSFQDEERLNRGDQPKYVSKITGKQTEEAKGFAAFFNGFFHDWFLFAVEHKNTTSQANTQAEDESSRALSETSYYLEFVAKEEQVQDWDETEMFMELKRLLQEKMNNNEIEDWIQVPHDEIPFKRNLHVETTTEGMNNLIIPLFFCPQNNLNVKQRSSDELVRALMRSVCESVIVACK